MDLHQKLELFLTCHHSDFHVPSCVSNAPKPETFLAVYMRVSKKRNRRNGHDGNCFKTYVFETVCFRHFGNSPMVFRLELKA